jgi:hypothetical protein
MAQSRQSEAFSQVVGIRTPPTPHPQVSVPPPLPVPWGGAHSQAREGLGEPQFRRGDIHCGTFSIYVHVLCGVWFSFWKSQTFGKSLEAFGSRIFFLRYSIRKVLTYFISEHTLCPQKISQSIKGQCYEIFDF